MIYQVSRTQSTGCGKSSNDRPQGEDKRRGNIEMSAPNSAKSRSSDSSGYLSRNEGKLKKPKNIAPVQGVKSLLATSQVFERKNMFGSPI